MFLISFLLSLITPFCLIPLWFVYRNITYWKRRGIPHDPPDLLHGNLLGLRSKYHIQDIYRYYYNKYKGTGPFAGFYFFQQPSALVLDINLAKNVLIKDFPHFINRPAYYNEKDDPVSAHLFALDGNKWKRLRQKLTPTFTSGKMRFMFPTVLQVTERFVDKLEQLTAENEGPIEIRELFARFTTDVIGTCAFGIECNSLNDPQAEFRLMGRRIITDRRHSPLVIGLAQGYPQVPRKLGIGVIHPEVAEFFLRVVRETVAHREQEHIRRNDFMDMLIDMKNSKDLNERLTLEEIAAQTFIFFQGGFETSATTGGFALYELAQHQDMQDKVRREINEVLAKHDNKLSYECLLEMKYLDQVIAETLRLYTVLPAIQRRCVKDYPIPGHPRYTIEKGINVIIPATAIHRDPKQFPDPDTFNPEHFSPEQFQTRDPISWLAFGDGPRNCIGLRFGKLQTRMGLAMLLKRFRFTLDPRTAVPMEYDKKVTVCSAKEGIFLRIERV